MSERRKLVIVGAGGLGLEAHWIARAMSDHGPEGWEILGFADDSADRSERVHAGVPILCPVAEIAEACGADTHVHIAVGDNKARQRVAEAIGAQGLAAATLIHPRADLAPDATIGEGSYVGPFATLAPQARVGRHVIVNIRVVVGHEAIVGDYSQLAPGAVLTGACRLGVGVFVGSNASLYPGRSLGDHSSVASNSFVIADVSPNEMVMGVPSNPVFKRK